MNRSFTLRGTALVLATVLNVSAVWLLAQQPAAGRGFGLDTAGAERAEALASSAQPPSGDRGKFGGSPAGRTAWQGADSARLQDPTLDGRCVSICLLLHA